MLFDCSSHQDATIDSLLVSQSSGGFREWNVTFVHDFNDWEIGEIVSFFHLLPFPYSA